MSTNIIQAIINLVKNPTVALRRHAEGNNRANAMGEAFEEYVKDLFANTLNESDMASRKEKLCKYFSYLGNSNNPPDAIIKGGDAIEIKKIENQSSSLALNSSYPKAKLFAKSPMITKACRECEEWDEKDIIYVVGVVKGNMLSRLCMVYGVDYAASEEVYTRIKRVIADGVNSIPDVEFADTKELARVNRVDPLGITYLRVRGMWGIDNPMKVFSELYAMDEKSERSFMALINMNKYNSLEGVETLEALQKEVENLSISDVLIQDPDNPAKLKSAKLVIFIFD